MKVLVADDQPDVLAALRLLLKSDGFEARCVNSPGAILSSLELDSFDLLLMDLNYARDTTSGEEGLDLLAKLQQMETRPAVVVMTAWGSIELAVEAMRRGAADFVMKPWDNAKLLATIRKHAEPVRPSPASHARLTDLNIARRVQQRLLPRQYAQSSTLEYSARCVQAGEVGGDYYDLLDLGGGQTLLVLADVSGKGVPAALLMAHLQATLRSRFLTPQPLRLPPMMREVNLLFYQSTEPEHFATVFLGIYDDQTRELRYVNCGHTPPVLLRSGGGLERLEPTATVLGAFAAFRCDEDSARIGAGDLFAAVSDGVVEARRADQEQFGATRLVNVLRAAASTPVTEVPAKVVEAVAEFSGYGQEDDLTVLVARGR
ncbi:MAG: SpoIIE family protein phosphatase [Bryobacteraceae bacterium]|nr:SpoIIE family protein phosphatase [Bryobacteraceae bacterium]